MVEEPRNIGNRCRRTGNGRRDPGSKIMTGAKSVPILEIWRIYIGTDTRQKGHAHWAACPFHADKTPSLCIDSNKQCWHCFSCGAGGSAIDLVMKIRDVGFREACETIERDFGFLRGVPIQARRPAKTRAQVLNVQYGGLIDILLLEKRRLRVILQSFSAADIEKIPAHIIHLMGEIETLLDELLTGSIDEKAMALRKGLAGNGKYRRNAG